MHITISKHAEEVLLNGQVLMGILERLSAATVKWNANRCSILVDYVNLAFRNSTVFPTPWVRITPLQIKEEITELLKILAKRKPKYVLEIGTALGGTLFLFSMVSSLDALITSIDLPGGKFGGGYSKWKVPLFKSFAVGNQKINLIRGSSHAASTLKMVENILGGHEIDFLFIDGDHTYEGVRADFETYGSFVRKNGLIAFHDIVPGPTGPSINVGDVPIFWSEIKCNFAFLEIIGNSRQAGFGIGLLFV